MLRRPVEREGFDDLLGGPCGAGMCRDIEVNDSAAIMTRDDEDVQDSEPHLRNCEDVDGGRAAPTWLLRNVFPVCEVAPGFRTMYFATQACEILAPNFMSSP
jgi:hypothetical protein